MPTLPMVGLKQMPIMYKKMSRKVNIITYAGLPVLWCSKLQTEIALITTEVEYIALIQEMHNIIPFYVTTKINTVSLTFILKNQKCFTRSSKKSNFYCSLPIKQVFTKNKTH